MFPDWWCKIIFSVPENCTEDYNWFDFSIYEFIFTVVIVLVIKWIIYCFFFIIGLIIPDKTEDATIISPTLLEKEIEDIEGGDLEFDEDDEDDEDVFSLEEESKKMTKREEDLVENIDKEIETSIVNITRKGVNK